MHMRVPDNCKQPTCSVILFRSSRPVQVRLVIVCLHQVNFLENGFARDFEERHVTSQLKIIYGEDTIDFNVKRKWFR